MWWKSSRGGVLSSSAVRATASKSISNWQNLNNVAMTISAVRPSDFTISSNALRISKSGTYKVDVQNVIFEADSDTAGGSPENFSGEASLTVTGSGTAEFECYDGMTFTTALSSGDTIKPTTDFHAESDRGTVKMTLSFTVSRIR